jgi:hypothetical protein
LDAFCHSFGYRVKRLFDGTVEIATNDTAEQTLLDSNISAQGPIILGQRLTDNAPKAQDDGTVGKVFVTQSRRMHPTETNFNQTAGATSRYINGAQTLARTSMETGVDVNGKAIEGDYYSLCYPGFRDWTPTIFDDFLLFCFGGEYQGEQRDCFTRVQSHPANLLMLDSWVWEVAASTKRLKSQARFVYVPSAHATPTAPDSGTTGHDCSYVTGHPSDDCTGASHDATITLYPIVNGQYSLTAGSVIGVVPTIDGHWPGS